MQLYILHQPSYRGHSYKHDPSSFFSSDLLAFPHRQTHCAVKLGKARAVGPCIDQFYGKGPPPPPSYKKFQNNNFLLKPSLRLIYKLKVFILSIAHYAMSLSISILYLFNAGRINILFFLQKFHPSVCQNCVSVQSSNCQIKIIFDRRFTKTKQ